MQQVVSVEMVVMPRRSGFRARLLNGRQRSAKVLCCVGGYPVVIGSLARPETGNWR